MLHKAVERQESELVKLVIFLKADPNLQDKFGQTPLHIAAEKVDYYIVRQLMGLNPRLDIIDNFGKTAQQILIEKDPLVAQLFRA